MFIVQNDFGSGDKFESRNSFATDGSTTCSFYFFSSLFFSFFPLIFFIFPLVPLGSIPELPAESCAEIKRSEGAAMRSGGFWIQSSVNSGKASLVNCDVGESNGEYLSKLPL